MGIHAKGIQLQMSDMQETPQFTAIAELTNIDGPGLTVPTVDATAHDMDWAEHLGGIPDGGEVTIEGNYLPASATQGATTGLLSNVGAGAIDFKVIFPDTAATTWEFSALVTGFTPRGPVADKLSFSATLKLTGQPTLA